MFIPFIHSPHGWLAMQYPHLEQSVIPTCLLGYLRKCMEFLSCEQTHPWIIAFVWQRLLFPSKALPVLFMLWMYKSFLKRNAFIYNIAIPFICYHHKILQLCFCKCYKMEVATWTSIVGFSLNLVLTCFCNHTYFRASFHRKCIKFFTVKSIAIFSSSDQRESVVAIGWCKKITQKFKLTIVA